MGCAASMPSATLELSDRLTSGQHCCTSGRTHQVDRELPRSSSSGGSGGWPGKQACASGGGTAVFAECAPGEAGRAARLKHQQERRQYARASRELHRDSVAGAASAAGQPAPARPERHCYAAPEARSPFQDMLCPKVVPEQEAPRAGPWPQQLRAPPHGQAAAAPPGLSTPQKRCCEEPGAQQPGQGAGPPLMRGDSAASVPTCLEYTGREERGAPRQQEASRPEACLPALRQKFSGDSASSPQHQQPQPQQQVEKQHSAPAPAAEPQSPRTSPREAQVHDSAFDAAPSPFGSVILPAWQPRQPQSIFGALAAGSPFGSGTATASPFGSQTLLTSRQPLPPLPNPFGAGCGSGSSAASSHADSGATAYPRRGLCEALPAPLLEPPQPAQDTRMCPPRAGLDGVNLRKELHIEPLLQLVCTVLQCDVALLTLAAGDQMLVMRKGRLESREETEAGPLWQHRAALPIPACCAALVVPDTSADHRVAPEVWERTGLGFFCAKPLCSGAARRSGTLCLGTAAPREFGAGPLGILSNLCELVVHEVEAAAERAEQRAQSEKLLAAMDLYQEAFMLVDTTVPHWRILHLNVMAANEIEMAREDARDAVFWEAFEVRDPATGELAQPWVPCEAAAAKGQKFVLHKVRRAGAADGKLFVMRFRPACQEMQPAGAIGCGLPITAAGRPFYFVEVSEAPRQAPSRQPSLDAASSHHSGAGCHVPQVHTPKGVLSLMNASSAASACCESPMMMDPATSVPFPGLELGFVLGRGAFGSVFRGTYNGEPVAVKIIVDNDQARVKDGLPVEAHITAGLNHVNVVRTIAHAWRPLSAHVTAGMSVWDSADSAHGGASEGETWLLLELCDRGTLQDAILNHFFKEAAPARADAAPPGDRPAANGAAPPSPSAQQQQPAARAGSDAGAGGPLVGGSPGAPPRMEAILHTALEVAEGMGYLHARGIVHGDLTGANILLQHNQRAPHGITAKVADFGLSREMHCRSRVETRTCGTITHMPPELLSSDVVSKAADVYAFGVLLWELFHGTRAWEGYNHAQVIHAVAIMKASLEFSPGAPAPYLRLARGCMAADPKERPCFVDVTLALRLMLAAAGQDPGSQPE